MKMVMGTRTTNKVVCHSMEKPEGSVGIGRNGAMPEPEIQVSTMAWYVEQVLTSVTKLRELLHGCWYLRACRVSSRKESKDRRRP